MFAISESQQMMIEMADRLLAKENEFEARRHRLSGDAPDRMALWPHLAEQGLIGALASEATGGFGGTARDLSCLMALSGKYLVVEPMLHTALAVSALEMADATVASDLMDQLMSGETVVAFAHQEGANPFAALQSTAEAKGDGFQLYGAKTIIRHADSADAYLVTAMLYGEPAMFLVNANTQGIGRDATRLIDGSAAADLRFDGADAMLVAKNAGAMLARIQALYLIGLSAEAAGILRALADQTFAYLITRQQFGTPLAGFQALQHRAADMHIAAEEARVLAARAADLYDLDSPSALLMAVAAKARVDDVARIAANDAVQLHGGMGVSDELVISHYFRRIAAIRAEGGSAEDLRAFIAESGESLPMTEGEDATLAAFRAEVAEFTRTYLPKDIAAKGASGMEIGKDDYVRWQKILREKGWFAAAWPKDQGGPGWDIEHQLVMLQEAALNNAPLLIPYGVSMVGPVLQSFGNEMQQAAHLPGILSSDVWWCQGYSEPNSGSDLASLRTTAVRDGDDYIVNGTKMWTTEAHWADWMHILVRTNKDVKAQAGISFLLINMTSPGIDIRPIVTIDGQHHTNQVFLDNVRVPATNLVGEEGQGWTIAKFLLANERVAIADTGPKMRLLGQIRTMFAAAVADGRIVGARQSVLADRMASVESQLAMLVALEQDYVRQWSDGEAKNGPEASILKIRGTEILQALVELALAIEGPLGAVHDPHDLHLPADTTLNASQSASMMAHHYLYSRCWSIFGGTNEIQRNIIAGSLLR